MKNHFLTRLAVTFVSLHLFVLPTLAGGNTFEKPDFNFPQEVEANAYTVLHKALQEGNQHDAALAAMQISEARVSVSEHNVTGALALIDSVMEVGKLTPDYQALLYYYKSQRVDNLNYFTGLSGLGDDQNPDISMWGYEKKDSLSYALLRQALDPLGNGDHNALLRPTSDYKNILSTGNEWGKQCMPYLYDFLIDQLLCHHKTSPKEGNRLLQQWIDAHAKDKSLYPTLYLDYRKFNFEKKTSEQKKELFQRYKNRQEVGLLYYLAWQESERNLYYIDYQQYLKDFPNSPFKSYIKNLLDIWDIARVDVNLKNIYHSQQDIQVNVVFENNNSNECKVSLYRYPVKYANKETIEKDDSDKIKRIKINQLELVDEIVVSNDTTHKSITATFRPQPYGVYLVQTSMRNSNGKWVYEEVLDDWEAQRQSFCVSDIRCFKIHKDYIFEIYTVNAISGAPMPHVKITNLNKSSVLLGGETDQDGKFVVKQQKDEASTSNNKSNDIERYFNYTLSFGEDKYLNSHILNGHFYDYLNPLRNTNDAYMAKIMTDLAIYRPGEKVNVSAILYHIFPTERKLIDKEYSWTLRLIDADRKEVEKVVVKNNRWGQLTHQFTLPTDRMNGTYRIELSSPEPSDPQFQGITLSQGQSFEVSEYKMPTFSVDLNDTEEKPKKDRPVIIRGKAQTFSGLPLVKGTVQGKLKTSSYWFWHSESTSHTFTTTTDAEGKFEYECPTEWFKDLDQRYAYRISVQAKCTDEAGETQSADKTLRWGKSRRITLSQTEILIPGDGRLTLPISYESTEADNADVTCHYTLTDTETQKVVKQGEFSARQATVAWNDVPSGKYTFKSTVKDEPEENGINEEIILYRAADQMPPRGVKGLWLPETMQEVSADGKARVRLGCHQPFHIYYIASDRTKITAQGWQHYEAGMHWFELPMSMGKDEQLDIELFFCIDGKLSEQRVTLH